MANFNIIKPDFFEKSFMQNRDMIKQLISMYLEQSPTDFAKLATAIEHGEYHEIASCAHHIKPTMEYIGATDLRIQFEEMENLAKEGADNRLITKHFESLEQDFTNMMAELKEYYVELD